MRPSAPRSEASHVADTAKDQARQVKDEFATQASGLVDQAKSELRDQGRTQADQVSNAIRRVSDQAGALAAGRVDEAGNVADYVRRAGDQVGRVADRLDERGVDGVVNDVQSFALPPPGGVPAGLRGRRFRHASAAARRRSRVGGFRWQRGLMTIARFGQLLGDATKRAAGARTQRARAGQSRDQRGIATGGRGWQALRPGRAGGVSRRGDADFCRGVGTDRGHADRLGVPCGGRGLRAPRRHHGAAGPASVE